MSTAFLVADLELKALCNVNCEFCAQPLRFEAFTARERCNGDKCSNYLLQAAA